MSAKCVTAILLALVVIVAGCSPAASTVATVPASSTAGSPGSPGPSGFPGPASSPGDTPSGSAGGGDDGAAQIVPGLTAPPALDLPPLGAVGFRVDTARTAGVDLPADGSETTLTLTDGAGLTWKLVIPGDAIDAATAISMTALADLVSADIPGRLAGGILLEPDGLTFVVPARLTVTGGSPGGTPVLLTGGHDGSAMQFALPADDAGGSAWISHFSSVIDVDVDVDAALQSVTAKLDRDWQAATAAAQALLKDTGISVPEPPSIPLDCVAADAASANAKSLDDFVAAVGNPEMDLIRNLLAVERQRQLLGQSGDPSFALVNQLLGRLEKKVLLLMETYTGRPEKLQAVTTTALGIARSMELLGSPATAILGQLAAWWRASIDPLLDDVIEKHDYAKAATVVWVARSASLLGAAVDDDEVLRKLEAALTFGLEAQLNVHWPVGDWLLASKFVMANQGFASGSGRFLTGEGTGEYVSLSSEEFGFTEASGFPVRATLQGFDACAGTAELTVDRFSADAETYQSTDPDNTTGPVTGSIVKPAFEAAFEEYLKDGVYAFPVEVHNLDPRMVDQTIEAAPPSQGLFTLEFDIVLTHTPKLVK
jgi:hypothetical protein